MYQCVGITHLVKNRQSKNIKGSLNSAEPNLKADLCCGCHWKGSNVILRDDVRRNELKTEAFLILKDLTCRL